MKVHLWSFLRVRNFKHGAENSRSHVQLNVYVYPSVLAVSMAPKRGLPVNGKRLVVYGAQHTFFPTRITTFGACFTQVFYLHLPVIKNDSQRNFSCNTSIYAQSFRENDAHDKVVLTVILPQQLLVCWITRLVNLTGGYSWYAHQEYPSVIHHCSYTFIESVRTG